MIIIVNYAVFLFMFSVWAFFDICGGIACDYIDSLPE